MSPEQQCEQFNKEYPVGTDIMLRKDSGQLVSTKTRSAAEVVNGREAVIWLEGVGGWYLLDRVTPFDKILRVAGRRTIGAAGNSWRPMDTAPRDGTVIEACARVEGARAGFPQYIDFIGGRWQTATYERRTVVPWCWRPRDEYWPDERTFSESAA